MADKTPSSPDSLQLRANPISSVRLSKKAAFFAIGVISVILLVIVSNVSAEKPKTAKAEEKKEVAPALSAAREFTHAEPGISKAPQLPVPPLPSFESKPLNQQIPSTVVETSPPEVRPDPQVDERLSAMRADSVAPKFGANGNDNPLALPMVAANAGKLLPGQNPAGGMDDPALEPDLNRQAQKQAFRARQASAEDAAYLDSQVNTARSPYELKTGTVIPAVMIGTINSDLPGEIVAQVSQNVYDTATGNHLLIPQGTRLFGRYDSNVTFGQDRLLIGWQRLIFPNAATLELKGMSGHDAEGSAGFSDQVNNHYGRIFGWGLVTSLISAGYQLSQPEQNTNAFGISTPSSQQTVAGAVGQQLAQLGMEMAKRNMRIQPTITIRKGYQFNVMVNKDMQFPASYRR
ncbi:conjugal transfer protein TrbI [Chitinimonas arctica]|uniref:Conjugal transfer protein TrbI n=1 Tax=Chitinimonas arctica TaxID=2594795 RepID=A0A516SHE0_9NEIS|nr:TrbI/VirB10 family protein [Chitinimonas arctica]QDQ27584.1 conjugal transfer protein TrbI [Chitinimonas arctica]